jgi:NADPH:quinone reductase-like Zn-dependent oxidoreductase
VLVEVHYISLNFGDLAGSARQPAGFIPGWDAAGIVVSAAANGSGPPVGTRVSTVDLDQGGWAERRSVNVGNLAIVPDAVGLDVAASLPVAGVSALRALRHCGSLFGKRVLITGASGGVGRFAVQLAAQSGATVIASVGSPARGEGLRELGADEVVIGLEGVEAPIDIVIDNVGGPQLGEAFFLLGEGGIIQCVGNASRQETVLPRGGGGLRVRQRSIISFFAGDQMGADIAVLLELITKGRLKVEIGYSGPWQDIVRAKDALFARTVAGKAVLSLR